MCGSSPLFEVVEHPTDLGPLPVQHWVVDDLVTGERAEVHLAGDVVLAADGHTWSVTLEELDAPPNLLPPEAASPRTP